MSEDVRIGEILGPDARGANTGQAFEKDEAKVRRRFWPTLRKAARQVPFTRDLVAAYYCAMDPDVPFRVRATLLGALAYFVSPIDAIPDMLLGVGFSDDVTVLMGAIAMVASHITDRHRERAKKALED
ncbi:YkvA family protein [Acuticoccus sp. I52.16.1]|uniref:YkvA family protein n=1 Tax=Acuticoccus sp. I52.16.1 TaxID=2928472 RepID=UPI001FD393AB|nr:YkvA family protein [Acuticoccus sp. I52.16.1]UOM36400.1 YkvA family protein [Acuticoccus sp. I52.16.1]